MTASGKAPDLGSFTDQTDLGPSGRPGLCTYDREEQVYRLSGFGATPAQGQEAVHFVWKRMRGNFIVTLLAESSKDSHPAKATTGWMVRAGLEADTPQVSAALHPGGPAALEWRRSANAALESLQAPVGGADVIQLERAGNRFTLSAARFGEPFTAVQIDGIDLGEEPYVGIFVRPGDGEAAAHAVCRNVRLVLPAGEGFDRNRDPFGSRLEILDVASGHRRILYSEDHVFEAPNWTRDGKALIYNRDGRLVHFDLETQARSLIDSGEAIYNNNDHVISFDGTRLAVSNHSPADHLSRIYTLPLEGGTPSLVTPLGPSYLHGWSPDGRSLVYCAERNGEYDVYRIPADGGDEIRLTSAPGLNDGPEYSPDGRYIYFNSVRTGRMQIWRMKPDGRDQEQVTDDAYNNWFAHVSPDGRWIAFISYLVGEVDPGDHPPAKRVYIRRMAVDGGTPRVLAYVYGGQGTMNVPSWSPDGRQIAFVSNTVPF
jgi:TolB protein